MARHGSSILFSDVCLCYATARLVLSSPQVPWSQYSEPIPQPRYVCFQLTQTALCLSAVSQDALIPALVLCTKHVPMLHSKPVSSQSPKPISVMSVPCSKPFSSQLISALWIHKIAHDNLFTVPDSVQTVRIYVTEIPFGASWQDRRGERTKTKHYSMVQSFWATMEKKPWYRKGIIRDCGK